MRRVLSSLFLLVLTGVLFYGCSTNPVIENAVRQMNREAERTGSPYRYRITPDGRFEKYSIGPQSEVPERWTFNFDSRSWQVGHQMANQQQAIREYVLSGQSVHDWTELVTSLYSAKDVPLGAWFEQFRGELSRRCPSIRLSVIEESGNSIIFEWQHDGCQAEPAQHEIRRITRGQTGMFSLSYVEKTRQLAPEKRSIWVSIIRTATIKPNP